MKFRYCFTLMVILIILFSLAAVAASENITSDDICLDSDSQVIVGDDLDIDESQDASSDEVDLSVTVTGLNEDLKNTTIVEVPFKVIASVSGGVAHDVKVNIVHDFDEFEYFSHNATFGSYNPASHIWDIGDLNSSFNPSLTIVTKFDTQGRNFSSIGVIVIANATTSSNDVDLSNNFLIKPVVYAAPIYYTEESGDKDRPQHENHQGSEGSSSFVVVVIEEENGNSTNSQTSEDESQSNTTSGVNPSNNQNSNSKNGEGSKSNSQNGVSSNSNSNNVTKEINQDLFTKTINSLSNVLPNVGDSLGNLINDILNPNAPDEDSDGADGVDGIQAYDYTKIPILIFSLFLIALLAIGGYDKIKS